MPEIWLNYGSTDVVLDIKAENLEEKIGTDGKTLTDSEIKSKLESLDISKPAEFVVLNSSESVRKTLSIILERYDEKSIPKPSILADKETMNAIKNYIPEHTPISLNALSAPSSLFMMTNTSNIDKPDSLSCFIPFKTEVPVVITSSTITTLIPSDVLPSMDFVVPCSLGLFRT